MASTTELDRRRVLALLSGPSRACCREFVATASSCGFSVHDLGSCMTTRVPPEDRGLVVVCGDASDAEVLGAWLGRLPQDPPCFGVISEKSGPSAISLTASCSDFLFWPATIEEVELRLGRFVRRAMPEVPPATPDQLAEEFAALNLVGQSPAFRRVLTRIKRIAPNEATVLIEGETGTGKELVARAIHYLGPRRAGPFVPINCGAMPDALVENELFGHEPGAFTDARRGLVGVVEQARGGTLLLDEIEALSQKAQVVLLRFLESQEFRPLGSRSVRQADVRLIASTNTPLHELAAAGTFRADLMYRLNVLSVRLPPLSDRLDDIEPLSRHFLARLRSRYGGVRKTIAPETLAWLERRSWPGNVRELENMLHRAYLMNDSDRLVLEERPDGDPAADAEQSFRRARERALARFEREYLAVVMAKAGGNVTRAAQLAGKERRALGRLLKKHGRSRK